MWVKIILTAASAVLAAPAPAAEVATPPSTAASPAYAAETARNRAIIYDFVAILYGRMDFRRAFEKYVSPETYLQHHPGMPDGRDAAMKVYGPIFAAPGTRIEVKQILVDGDRATVHMVGHRSPDDPGANVINIFRLKDGKIVEHWDVTEPIGAALPSGRR